MSEEKYDIRRELKRIGNKRLRVEARKKIPELTGLTPGTLSIYMYNRKGIPVDSPYVKLIERVIVSYIKKEEELINNAL
jgi:hypothetical protein